MFSIFTCKIYVLLSFLHITASSPIISAENAYFWQLTDVHLDLNYLKHGCKGKLGDYQCDSPLELWVSALNNTRQTSLADPEFIIFSGDSVAHDDSLSKDNFLQAMRNVAAAIRVVFPASRGIPVIPVMGNHDVFPSNQFDVQDGSRERIDWCTELGSHNQLWGDWIRAPGVDGQQFPNGCYFSRRVEIATSSQPNSRMTPLIILSVNGMVWYSNNPKSDSSIHDPVGQFAWLEATLKKAREDGTRVLLVCHFAPGGTDNSPFKYRHMHPTYNLKFLQIVISYADIMIGGLFAHQHVDSFRVLTDMKGKSVASFFLTPSVSPMNLKGLGSFQPRIRCFEFSRSPSLALLDFHQFYFDLSALPSTAWHTEYSARSAYSLASLSPSALMEQLFDDFLVNETKWSAYWGHQMGLGMEHQSGVCPQLDTQKRCEHLCTLVYLDYSVLDKCLVHCSTTPAPTFGIMSVPRSLNSKLPSSLTPTKQLKNSSSWNTLPFIVAVIIAFLVILIGVVFLVNREICRRYRGCSSGARQPSRYDGMAAAFASGDGGTGDLIDTNALFNSSDIHGNEYPDDFVLDMNTKRSIFRAQKGDGGDIGKRVEYDDDDDEISFRTPGIPFGGKFASFAGLPTIRYSQEGLAVLYSHRQQPKTISPFHNCFRETPANRDGFAESSSRRLKYDDDIDAETAYDAEVEDDDLEEEELGIRKPKSKMNGISKNGGIYKNIKTTPVRRSLIHDLSNRYPSGPKMIENSRAMGGDASDNEYYSIHSSLQYLQPPDAISAQSSRTSQHILLHHHLSSSTSSARTGKLGGSLSSLSSAHLTPTHPQSHSPTYSPSISIIGDSGRGFVVVPFADA